MKKINLLFAAVMVLAIGFTSCDNKMEDPTIDAKSEITVDLNNMEEVVLEGNVVIDAEDTFETVTFKTNYESGDWSGLEYKDITGTSFAFSLTTEQLVNVEKNEAVTDIVIEVKTANKEASRTINVIFVPKDAVVLLTEPIEFSWNRKGGNDATGLAPFGLEWKENTLTNIVITPAKGTKLVELEVADWTGITTKEELEIAIEEGEGLVKWEVLPTKKEFNYVIATKTADGKLFLINPTKRTISPTDPGDRTVTGEYKTVELVIAK